MVDYDPLMEPADSPVFGVCLECGAGYGEAHCPEGGAAHTVPHSGWVTRPLERARALRECRRRGWMAAFVEGEGRRPCSADEPGASEDLGRYAYWLDHGDDELAGADGGSPPSNGGSA
jgi:hypothetical protein